MLLGAHVSLVGGLSAALSRITALGGNCLQTFASSPRSLAFRGYSSAKLSAYLQLKSQLHIQFHYLHAVYLLNLATRNPDFLQACIRSLQSYQDLAAHIGSPGTILHLGSLKGQTFSAVLPQLVQALSAVISTSSASVKLILENSAGSSEAIGSTFSELSAILSALPDPSRIGFCLDTQHAFAAGFPLANQLTDFDRHLGLSHLSVIHLNDSLLPFSSRRDRHANLGEGTIGLPAFTAFIADPRLLHIPLILETPGDFHTGPRKSDLDLVRSLRVQ